MRSPLIIVAIIALFLSSGSGDRLETRDSSELDPLGQTPRQIRWPKRTIEVAFSSSLLTPGSNFKSGSDVVGAARRALSRWSSMANLDFVITWSSATSVSPAAGGDGISLLTIADTLENEAFNTDTTAGRTRVFYDPETGAIVEADVSINPRPQSEDGTQLQFSTDGTPGTYDLESTFTHEIGHLLGLAHSAVLASTMQHRQAFNGTFGLPALTERTLSEDDRQKIRILYGPTPRLGRIEGKLFDNRSFGALVPLNAVNVWAENVATGKVVASGVSAADGSYSLEGLAPGKYRVIAASGGDETEESDPALAAKPRFRSFELSNLVEVKAEAATTLNYNLVPPQPSVLNPRVIGLNAELSTVALPLDPGKRIKIYLGGDGLDQVPGTSIVVNSPFFAIDPASLMREQLSSPFPVISVDLQVAANAPFGDYSIRLQANSGETAYFPGALTIDPGVAATGLNPVDDVRFFVKQHYLDVVGREPDLTSLDRLTAQFSQCGSKSDCLRARRIEISTSLLTENELPTNGVFLSGLYEAGLGRRPRFAEYESDRSLLRNRSGDLTGSRHALALAFVQRPDFERRYSPTLKGAEFVDAVILAIKQSSAVDLAMEREVLIGLFDGSYSGRAAILTRAVTNAAAVDAQYNKAFVLTQYFTYLRRDPDDDGYTFWVNVLKNKPLRDGEAARSMVCAFLNSAEYQSRFGMLASSHNGGCD